MNQKNPRIVPRLANLIAAKLRQQILNGDIENNSLLPKQDDLQEQLQVSRPSLSEALRILESEGLITVLRGKSGGALVHTPSREKAAFTVAAVLQSKKVRLEDVAAAIHMVIPDCIELAASRKVRKKTSVKRLRVLLQTLEDSMDDHDEYLKYSAVLHQEFINASGNETLMLIANVLEALWASHAKYRASAHQLTHPVTRKDRIAYNKYQKDIVDAIEAGDGNQARELATKYLRKATQHALTDDDQVGINTELLESRLSLF